MANKAKRQLSPEARAAAKARMEHMWADIRAGRRPDPREAARKAREAKQKLGNGVTPTDRSQAGFMGYPIPPIPGNTVLKNLTAPSDGPRSVELSPAIISLFKSGSVYVLRISDMRYNAIGAAIGRALTDGTSIVVVTPTDTRMFELRGQVNASTQSSSTYSKNEGALQTRFNGAESINMADEFTDDPQAEAQRLAQEAEVAARQAGARDTADLQDQLNQAETPAQRRAAIKALRDAEGGQANNSICGRCRGACVIMVPLESGGLVEQSCPVCKGQGSIRRYGAR